VIAQTGAFQTVCCSAVKPLVMMPIFTLPCSAFSSETAPGSGAQISAIAFINASFSFPADL
jgi:hypothetical protein